ncbi:MAG: hypothetical protein HQK58_09495 [Deltaproteobacteria bacterium]|nr:hypothetical protein [Deltaproteobacteria bacterium]
MNVEHGKKETLKQQIVEEADSASAAAQNILERGAEVYGQAEQAVSDAYDKTAQTVSETYAQAKSYVNENQGKTILIALGIGVGLGFILGASSHRSRGGRFAQPVVNALSDIALEFFR